MECVHKVSIAVGTIVAADSIPDDVLIRLRMCACHIAFGDIDPLDAMAGIYARCDVGGNVALDILFDDGLVFSVLVAFDEPDMPLITSCCWHDSEEPPVEAEVPRGNPIVSITIGGRYNLGYPRAHLTGWARAHVPGWLPRAGDPGGPAVVPGNPAVVDSDHAERVGIYEFVSRDRMRN